MANLVARNRARRVIAYVFTVPQRVERLSRELTDAVHELALVSLLDFDHAIHSTQAAIEDSARFVGEFRLLRHCEVDKLDLIEERIHQEAERITIARYHRAQVDGQLLVVRYFDSLSYESHSVRAVENNLCDYITSHDRILEAVSSVQRSHRNVVRIYGWGKGSRLGRFTVFKSGFIAASTLRSNLPNPTATSFLWAFKVLDAILHLRTLGVSWRPIFPSWFALDDHLEPIIGLRNDLHHMKSTFSSLFETSRQIVWMVSPVVPQSLQVMLADIQAAIANHLNEQLANLLNRFETFERTRWIITKADFSRGRILTDRTANELLQVAAQEPSWGFCEAWRWADIWLTLDKTRGHELKKGFKVLYFAWKTRSDWFEVHGVEEDPECVTYDWYMVSIPDAQRDEIRALFGIPVPSDQRLSLHVIATGGPGTYRAMKHPCTV